MKQKKSNLNIQDLAIKVANKKNQLHRNDKDLIELFNQIYPKLYYFINKYNSQQNNIEDILHEAIYKIYKNIHNYDPNYRFTTWAYNITKNVSMHYNNRVKLNYLDIDDSSVSSNISNEKIQIGNEFEELMQKEKELKDLSSIITNEIFCIEECSEKSAFIDSFINNKTNKMIAYENDIKINTVKTRIRRAKKIIKQRINKKYPDITERIKSIL